jgi:thioredoxin reductase
MKRFEEHAKISGSEVVYDTVIKIEQRVEGKESSKASDSEASNGQKRGFVITTARKTEYTCDFLIYATGNAYRHLDVPGEDRLL